MHIGVLSLFPSMFAALTDYGVTGRAVDRGLLTLDTINPRDFTVDKHRTVDDKPYGGGPGMVLKAPPLHKALQQLQANMRGSDDVLAGGNALNGGDASSNTALNKAVQSSKFDSKPLVVFLSPQGQRLNQQAVERFSRHKQLILIAGRYEGIDERFIESEVDEEWSIGDYVLSGGELPAMAMIDAIVRLLPGVLGDELSAQQDSFVDGLLDYPHYTRPDEYAGQDVPAVLLSGDHEKIRLWRLQQSLGRTWQRRPDLLQQLKQAQKWDKEKQALLQAFIDTL